MCVATTDAWWRAAIGRYSGSSNPLMSLPTTAPAWQAASSTADRHVSTDSGTGSRAASASMVGTTRSSSSASSTSGPGPALTPPDVEDVRALGHQLLGPFEERVEGERRAVVVERIRGAVEDRP